MFRKCANPACASSFDFRKGHLFRFHQNHAKDEKSAKSSSVRHFWLCDQCAKTHTLEYRGGRSVLVEKGHRARVAAQGSS